MTMTTRGILLDVDGTLLDSNDAHAAAYVEAMVEERLDVSYSRVRPLIGMDRTNFFRRWASR